jgi:hypothetical protein
VEVWLVGVVYKAKGFGGRLSNCIFEGVGNRMGLYITKGVCI